MGGRGQDGEYYRLVLHRVHAAQEKRMAHLKDSPVAYFTAFRREIWVGIGLCYISFGYDYIMMLEKKRGKKRRVSGMRFVSVPKRYYCCY